MRGEMGESEGHRKRETGEEKIKRERERERKERERERERGGGEWMGQTRKGIGAMAVRLLRAHACTDATDAGVVLCQGEGGR